MITIAKWRGRNKITFDAGEQAQRSILCTDTELLELKQAVAGSTVKPDGLGDIKAEHCIKCYNYELCKAERRPTDSCHHIIGICKAHNIGQASRDEDVIKAHENGMQAERRT